MACRKARKAEDPSLSNQETLASDDAVRDIGRMVTTKLVSPPWESAYGPPLIIAV